MRRRPGWWHPLRLGVFLIDALIRRVVGYEEFTDDPRCIFRVVWTYAPYAYTFMDGTHIPANAPVLALHFWNEHIPLMPPTGPDVRWALQFYRLLRDSLILLADYVETHPRSAEVRALYGRLFLSIQDEEIALQPLQRLGFELKPVPPPRSWSGRIAFWFVAGYAHALAWAYNPGSVRKRSVFQKRIVDVWMSRRSLSRYHLSSDRWGERRGL